MVAAASSIVPPIVIAEGQELMFFHTEADVLVQLEPWYPSDADYRAFDSRGRRLELFADPPIVEKHLIGPLWTDNAHRSSLFVKATEEEPGGADELGALLREWLAAVDVPLEPGEEPTLDQLLAKATGRAGFLS